MRPKVRMQILDKWADNIKDRLAKIMDKEFEFDIADLKFGIEMDVSNCDVHSDLLPENKEMYWPSFIRLVDELLEDDVDQIYANLREHYGTMLINTHPDRHRIRALLKTDGRTPEGVIEQAVRISSKVVIDYEGLAKRSGLTLVDN